MRTSRRNIVGNLVADFKDQFGGAGEVFSFGVAHDGKLYAALADVAEPTREQYGIGVFPKSRLVTPIEYRIMRWHEGRIDWVRLPPLSVVVSFVQPVPEGILVVGARCHWRPEGPETNAVVADLTGRVLRELTLGDGIEDVAVSRDGTIWVSYFDEGVFGNFGWDQPGPPPIGAPGVVAFTSAGAVCFSYDSTAAHTHQISDACAMNVAVNGDVWVYFYTEFPIVRIANGSYQKWSFGIGGAHGLAVQDTRALLVGDYDSPDLGRVLDLGGDGVARLIEEVLIVDDGGNPIEGARMSGLGSDLYLFKDTKVWVVRKW